MRSQVAPDPFAFAEQLKNIVHNHSPYAQAIAFTVGERRFRLTRKTMAGMVGRDVQYVSEMMQLLDECEGLMLGDLFDQIGPMVREPTTPLRWSERPA